MMISMNNLGSVGIINDMPAENLPLEAWSGGVNVTFRENAVRKSNGWSEPVGTPTVVPYFTMPYTTVSDSYWIYASLGKVYVTDGTTHTDITKTATTYSGTAEKNWTGIVFGGVPILNNGIDPPQQWSPPQVSQLLTDLSNWPAGAECGSLRGFKQFLIAMDYTNGASTNFPRLVKWSHGAAFNSVPSSWDETDATLDAGEYELADTRGAVLDGLAYRDSFLIYKDDSIWGMNFVGGGSVFRFYQLSLQLGALSKRCIVEWERGQFVFGTNDLIITDGQSVKSIADRKSRNRVYNSIDTANFKRCFVVPNRIKKEIWACYPGQGASFATEAMVWNWEENTISFRELPSVGHGGFGVVKPASTSVTFDTAVGTFDVHGEVYDTQTYNPTETRILMAGTTDTKLYLMDDPATNTKNGTNMLSYVERTGLFNDSAGTVKYCRAVFPKMSSTGPVLIYVGGQMALDEPIAWEGPFVFDPSTDYKIDCEVAFRWMAFKVGSETDVDWNLTSYEMDIIEMGRN